MKAKLNNLRISPRKVRMSADLIRNCNVEEAIYKLDNTVKKSNYYIKKLLKSAIANAKNDFKLDKIDLIVSDIQIGEGATMKRWRPRAYGRASQILKRTSKVSIVLKEKANSSEQKETKNKDNKKTTKQSKKNKLEKGVIKTEGKIETTEKVDDNKTKTTVAKKGYYEVENKRKESRQKGWNKKIFRRKAN